MTSKCAIILLIVVTLNASVCCNAKKRKQVPVPVDMNVILKSGQNLNIGDSLQNNNYVLTMQQDCKLVLYDSGNVIWATNTGALHYNGNCFCAMQYDGNFGIFDSTDPSELWPIWSTNNTVGSYSGDEYALILQNDRNLVIYEPAIWATATNA